MSASEAPGQTGSADWHSRGPNETGFAATMWRLWVVFVWLIPLLLFAVRSFVPVAGWEVVALLFYFPFWYLPLTLLGMVPWWVWRSRAKRAGIGKTSPPPKLLVTSMVVHWAGLVLVTVAFPGVGSSERITPILGKLLPLADMLVFELLAAAGLLAAVVGVVGAILASCLVRTSRISRTN